MAVPGTGSTNQAMSLAAFKKLAGKANTSALREFYEETIPSNVQINTKVIFGEDIPQTVSATTLYAQFSSSAGASPVAEFVEFHVQSISGTTYDANAGSFGEVGFGAGDEAQSSGPHGFELLLTSSYQTLSSNAAKGTGYFVNNQVVNASNGGLQLISPSFGPQSGNNYALELYTDHPSQGGSRIYPTDPVDWIVDYFNGVIFIQDYKSTKVPTYARGFIYLGKFANTKITEAASAGSLTLGNGADNRVLTATSATALNGESNLTFDGTKLSVQGGLIHKRRAVTSNTAAANDDYYLGVSVSSTVTISLPNASTLTAGQTYVIKDEGGTLSDSVAINVTPSTGGQTIDGEATISLNSPYAAINVYTDGSTKYFIY